MYKARISTLLHDSMFEDRCQKTLLLTRFATHAEQQHKYLTSPLRPVRPGTVKTEE